LQGLSILHVSHAYFPALGGTELLMRRVSELLAGGGDEVTLFCGNCLSAAGFTDARAPRLPAGWERVNGVNVRRFPVFSRGLRWLVRPQYRLHRHNLPFNQYLRAAVSGPLIPGLTGAVRGQRADVIMASAFPLLHMFSALKAARQSGRPAVLHGALHPEDSWGYGRPMIYRAIRRATCYVANTEYERDHVISRGAAPERVFTVGAGVDAGEFAGVCGDEAKRRLGFAGHPVVGFIGRLGFNKGVMTLLRAMPSVWQKLPEARLLIAGGATDFAPELKRVWASWPEEMRARAVWLENFAEEEKPGLFAALDVLAYPSRYESFGIAFLEAWASGKPVIGCRSGAVACVIDEGDDGLLIDRQGADELSAALLKLLADPARAGRMGERGRQKVLARYTWAHVARKFREVYEEAIRLHRRTTS
jgi:glycosyltransferase involved in cell wall biosynthesis